MKMENIMELRKRVRFVWRNTMVTIKDISKACGVSHSTVSKVLNGYPDVSEETVALVRRTAEEMGYTPNAAARLLKTNRSHNIGVLFVDLSLIHISSALQNSSPAYGCSRCF